MAASRHRQSQAAAPPPTAIHLAPSASGQRENRDSPQHLSLHDLCTIAAGIKDALSAAISELCLDIHAIADRVHEVEKITAQHDTVLHRVTHKIDTHSLQLKDLQRHMEDLDNRGRHNCVFAAYQSQWMLKSSRSLSQAYSITSLTGLPRRQWRWKEYTVPSGPKGKTPNPPGI